MKKIIVLIAIALTSSISWEVIAQSCKESILVTTPDNRFTTHDNGTVSDNYTGLTWMRCSLGQIWEVSTSSCTGSANVYNWKSALTAAHNHTFANQSDWRLPNVKELASIIEGACYGPATNITIFPNTEMNFYWSATPTSNDTWNINFDDGTISYNGRDDDGHVRLVHGE